MKIAIYNHDLGGGGAERVILALLDPLRRLGATITLLLHRHHGALAAMVADDVRVIAFNSRRTANDLLPIARYLRQERPDALLANLHHNNVIAMMAKAISMSKTRVYICQHSILSQEVAQSQYRIIPKLYHYMEPLAAGIVAVSDGTADDFATMCRIRRNRVTTIYNPVITSDFSTKMQQSIDHPWLDCKPLFVAAGRLAPEKDYPTLLHAFARLHHSARLLILGDGPEKPKLESLVRELAIADRVCFVGFVANPLPYMRSATTFVLCSVYEGFGNAIVEALGCGTPVISTDCPGPAEILAGGRYGTLVPIGDRRALADAMAASHPVSSAKRSALQNRAATYNVDRAAQAYYRLLAGH
jgi:glycosyltransferase involved in cell wall biosynthesis